MTARIMMIDDHRMLREALQSALARHDDLAIVAEVASGREALDRLAAVAPDIVLLDIALPDMTGIDLAKQALGRDPDLRILALSGYTDRVFVDEMMKAGARGYVVKSAGTQELVFAIRAVLAGHRFLSPEITAAALGQHADDRPASQPPVSILGPREREVLVLLAQGMRSAAIATRLGTKPGTIDAHRSNIKKKLGLRSIAELTRYAIREGLLPS